MVQIVDEAAKCSRIWSEDAFLKRDVAVSFQSKREFQRDRGQFVPFSRCFSLMHKVLLWSRLVPSWKQLLRRSCEESLWGIVAFSRSQEVGPPFRGGRSLNADDVMLMTRYGTNWTIHKTVVVRFPSKHPSRPWEIIGGIHLWITMRRTEAVS